MKENKKRYAMILAAWAIVGTPIYLLYFEEIQAYSITVYAVLAGCLFNFYGYGANTVMVPPNIPALQNDENGNPKARTAVFWLTAFYYIGFLTILVMD
jgi:hypothetical protein